MITRQEFKYGAFEARIRGAEGSGQITAFFLYKNGSEWAGAEWQEQDFELFGKNGGFQTQVMTPGEPRVEHVVNFRAPTQVWERYYTYRMEWTPTALSFYVDGKLIRRETDMVTYAKLLDPARAEPMNLRLSLWAGDFEWSGAFDSTKVPSQVDVNWAKVESYTPGAGPGGSDFTQLWRDDFNSIDNNRWYFANWTFEFAVNDFAQGGARTANGYLQLKMTHWSEEGRRFTASPIDDGQLMPPVDEPPPVVDPPNPGDPTPPVVLTTPIHENLGRVHPVPATFHAFEPTRYQDATTGNAGDAVCGTGDLDLFLGADGICSIGDVAAGEWEEYDIQVPAAGLWSIALRVSSATTGSSLQATVDGALVGGNLSLPAGDPASFQYLTLPTQSLAAGVHRIGVRHLGPGMRLKQIKVEVAGSPLLPEAAVVATPHLLPATMMIKSYTRAGDRTVANDGGGCRDGVVDLVATTDELGDCRTTEVHDGEYLEFDVFTQEAGTWDLSVRAIAVFSGRVLRVDVNYIPVVLDVPVGAGEDFSTIDGGQINLPAGLSTIRFLFPNGFVDLHWFKLTRAGETTPSLPAQVGSLGAVGVDGGVQLSWAAAQGAGSYLVQRSVDGGAPWSLVNTTTATQWTDLTAPAGVVSFWRIVARNASGEAAPSATASASPLAILLPAVPAGLVATASDRRVALTWSAGANNTSFAILEGVAGATPVEVATTTATTWTDTGLVNGTAYGYQIVGIRGTNRSSPTATVVATPMGLPPSTVTGLAATTASAKVTLTWSASARATVYRVYRSSGGAAAALLATTSALTLTDATVVNGTAYTYTVVASSPDGDAAASAPVVATPVAPPPATAGLKVQYRAGTTGTTNGIRPLMRLVNTGTSSVDLSKVTIRYWFTKDGAASQNYWCDWAQIGSSNIVASFVNVTSRTGADNYLQLAFKTSAGTLAAGANTGEIQSRFSKGDWSNYVQANDASYDATMANAFTDAPKITVYVSGAKVWGNEP